MNFLRASLGNPGAHLLARSIPLTIIILMAGGFLGANARQQQPEIKSASAKSVSKSPATDRSEGEVEREKQKTEAIAVLYDVANHAGEISNVESQAEILAGAADVLWSFDQEFSKLKYLETAEKFLTSYSEKTSAKERGQFSRALKTIVSSLSKHDPLMAQKQLERFRKVAEEQTAQSNSVSLRDKLAVAQSSLEFDREISIQIATTILKTGVPSTFPNYLNDLEQVDAAAASELFDVAVAQLAANPLYTPVHATVLSAYTFKEKTLVLQTLTKPASPGTPIDFGSLTMNLPAFTTPADRSQAIAFLTSAYAFLQSKRLIFENQPTPNSELVLQCYFLNRKLHAYASKLNHNQYRQWDQLTASYEGLALRAGFSATDLANVTALAERMVAEGSIYQFDGGTSAFEKAKNAKNSDEKLRLLVRGIHDQLDAGQFTQAQTKLSEIEDSETRGRVSDYIDFRSAKAAIEKRKWREVNLSLARITNLEMQMYLLLTAASEALNSRAPEKAAEYVNSARSLVSKLQNGSSAARALVAIGSLKTKLDSSNDSQLLVEIIGSINRTENYEGDEYDVNVELPGLKLAFRVPNLHFNEWITQSAKLDWPGMIEVIAGITAPAVRARARVSACRVLLLSKS